VARAPRILPAIVLVGVLALDAAPARADERVNGMVKALRADPVFVSSAAVRSVPPAQVRALRRAVAAAAPLAMFVVVAPSFGDEPGLGTFHGLPDLLHDRSERDGIYLAVDLGPNAHAQAFGVQARFEVDDLSSAVYRDRPDAGAGEAARYAVAPLATGRRAPVPGIEDETVRPGARRGRRPRRRRGRLRPRGLALGGRLAPSPAGGRRRSTGGIGRGRAGARRAIASRPGAQGPRRPVGRACRGERSADGCLRRIRGGLQAARGRRAGRRAEPRRRARARPPRRRDAARPASGAVLLRPAPRGRQDPHAVAPGERGDRHPGVPLVRAQG